MKILVADDEPLLLRTIGDRLAREGHEVLRAENGRVALEILDQHPVDLVLTDIVMPDTDGIEVVRALRRTRPETRVICMSAHDEVYLNVARLLGAVRVLVKPFEWSELQEAIGSAAETPASPETENRHPAPKREQARSL